MWSNLFVQQAVNMFIEHSGRERNCSFTVIQEVPLVLKSRADDDALVKLNNASLRLYSSGGLTWIRL